MMAARIGVGLLWWGPPLAWIDQFVKRASATKCIEAVLIGDAAAFAPAWQVPRLQCTPGEFAARASACSGVPVHKTEWPSAGKSVAELRPLLADMFPEVFGRYDWWGYGEFDTVWGQWDSFLTTDLLSRYDMIGSNSYMVSGPFTIFRNAPAITKLYRKRLDLVAAPKYCGLDEAAFDPLVRAEAEAGRMRILYPGVEAHDRLQRWNRCRLHDGKLYQMDAAGSTDREILLFHFPRTKKWPLADSEA